MKHRKHSNSGFSLIDMIMGMSIIAIAIVGIQVAHRNYVNTSSKVEVGLRAVSLGNSVMNIIRMHPYDEYLGDTLSVTLGPDAGESSLSDYDDVDDYDQASWDFSADGYAGFDITTDVFYVNINTSWLNEVAYRTDFKRITVSIGHPVMEAPLVFSSIVANLN